MGSLVISGTLNDASVGVDMVVGVRSKSRRQCGYIYEAPHGRLLMTIRILDSIMTQAIMDPAQRKDAERRG